MPAQRKYDWDHIFEEFEKSGVRTDRFCEINNVNLATFANERRRRNRLLTEGKQLRKNKHDPNFGTPKPPTTPREFNSKIAELEKEKKEKVQHYEKRRLDTIGEIDKKISALQLEKEQAIIDKKQKHQMELDEWLDEADNKIEDQVMENPTGIVHAIYNHHESTQ